MTWMKVDDKLHSHPKARRAGLEAMGLWVVAGSFASDYVTEQGAGAEGFVPGWFVDSWPRGRRLARRLVEARLWVEDEHDGEAGWRFHDWLERNPSADQVARDRESARERQARRRRRLSEGSDPTPPPDDPGDGDRDTRPGPAVRHGVTNGVSHTHPVPVPVPEPLSGSPTAAASPQVTPANGGGGITDTDVDELLRELAAHGIRLGGIDRNDRHLIAGYLELHGMPALMATALEGQPPDVVRGCLIRWRSMPARPRPRAVYRCPEHELNHHGTCPSCRADQLAEGGAAS